MKYDEGLNKWRSRVTDLEDQIRMLQHEVTVMLFEVQSILFFNFHLCLCMDI